MRQQSFSRITAVARKLMPGLVFVLLATPLSIAESPVPVERVKALATFSGRVVDVAGHPVPNATVTLRHPHMEEARDLPVETDASGSFTLWDDASDWDCSGTCTWFLSATAAGYAGATELFFCNTKDEAEKLAEWFPELQMYFYGQTSDDPADRPVIVVEPTGSVRGRAVDAFGQPVTGIAVTAFSDRNKAERQSSRTDADGAFRFDNLLPGNTQVSLEAYPEAAWFFRQHRPHTVTVPSGGVADVPPLHWFTPDQTLNVRVSGYDGQPAPNARIYLTPLFPSGVSEGTRPDFLTGPDGRTTIEGLYPGNYVLSAAPYPGFCLTQTLTVSVPGVGAVFRLAASAFLSGQVVDDDTGQPVNDFYVLLTPEENSDAFQFRVQLRRRWTRDHISSGLQETPELPEATRFLDSQGCFSVEVPRPGQWKLQIFAAGYAYKSRELTLSGCDTEDTGIIKLRPESEDEVLQMMLEEAPNSGQDNESEYSQEPEPETEEGAFPWKDNPAECPMGWLNVQATGPDDTLLSEPEIRIYNTERPFHGPERRRDDPVCPPEHISLYPGRYRIYAWACSTGGCIGGRLGVQEVVIAAATRKTVRISPPQGPVTLIGEVRVNGLTPESGEVRAMTANGDMLARGNIEGGRFVLPGMPSGQTIVRLIIAESHDPFVPGLTAFQTVVLPRDGCLRHCFDLESAEFCVGELGSLGLAQPVRLAVFSSDFNIANLSRLDDILKADSMQKSVLPDFQSETFSPEMIAAGRYTLTAAIYPADEDYPEKYAWTRSDWPGTLCAAPITLTPETGRAGYGKIRFAFPPLQSVSETPAEELDDIQTGEGNPSSADQEDSSHE